LHGQTSMGKLDFCGYLILILFYPAREIRENLMNAKNVFYSMPDALSVTQPTASKH